MCLIDSAVELICHMITIDCNTVLILCPRYSRRNSWKAVDYIGSGSSDYGEQGARIHLVHFHDILLDVCRIILDDTQGTDLKVPIS